MREDVLKRIYSFFKEYIGGSELGLVLKELANESDASKFEKCVLDHFEEKCSISKEEIQKEFLGEEFSSVEINDDVSNAEYLLNVIENFHIRHFDEDNMRMSYILGQAAQQINQNVPNSKFGSMLFDISQNLIVHQSHQNYYAQFSELFSERFESDEDLTREVVINDFKTILGDYAQHYEKTDMFKHEDLGEMIFFICTQY